MFHRLLMLSILAALPTAALGQGPIPKPRQLATRLPTVALALSADGKSLATIDQEKQVGVWSVPGSKFASVDRLKQKPESLALRPDGTRLAVTDSAKEVHVYDVAGRKKLATLKGVFAAFSPDGKWFALARGDEAEVHDADTLKSVQRFRAYQVRIEHLLFRPNADGKTILATFGGNGPNQLWDVTANRRETFFFPNNGDRIMSATFRSDGKVLAGGAWGGRFHLWDFTGDFPSVEITRQNVAPILAFRPNSNLLAIAQDKFIDFWDVSGSKAIARVDALNVKSLAFSADGNTLAAAEANGPINIWDLSKLPARPMTPLPGKSKSQPDFIRSFKAYVEEMPDIKGSDTRSIVFDLVDARKEVKDPTKPSEKYHLSPLNQDMLLIKAGKTADLKELRPGDLVEYEYSTRRFPSIHVTVLEHDADRSRRQEAFIAALKPLAVSPFRVIGGIPVSEDLSTLKPRDRVAPQVEEAETQAAADVFKLVEEKPGDRQAFLFLTEVMALRNRAASTKAVQLLFQHHLKDERMRDFLNVVGMRARAPDELFVRLLDQKDAPELRAGACMVLANRAYHRAKLLQEKDKRVRDREAIALATKYHEWLKREFPKEVMADLQHYPGDPLMRGFAGAFADKRLAEMRSTWVGEPKKLPAGDPALEIVGIDKDGKKIKLSDFKGKTVVLRVLPPTPPNQPPAKLPPNFKKYRIEESIQKQFGNEPVVCVLVCWAPTPEALRDLLKREKVDWPVIGVGGTFGEYFNQMNKDWPTRVPGIVFSTEVFIIDPQGNVRLREYRMPNGLNDTIDALLQEAKRGKDAK